MRYWWFLFFCYFVLVQYIFVISISPMLWTVLFIIAFTYAEVFGPYLAASFPTLTIPFVAEAVIHYS
jgi:hypothetical protein